MSLFGLGTMFYVALLLINAIAILNEERFLARSKQIRGITCLSMFSQNCSSQLAGYPILLKYGM